ncbi:MAG: hypothetical protein JNG84_10925 [Archangium sp.]|nr:hypothetical protein [Archangium sp.]
MAEIIDLSLVAESRKTLKTLLEARGINYFLSHDARTPFRLEPSKVDLVVRTAAKLGAGKQRKTPPAAYEHARTLVRRELIRRVVAEMLQTGL